MEYDEMICVSKTFIEWQGTIVDAIRMSVNLFFSGSVYGVHRGDRQQSTHPSINPSSSLYLPLTL